MDQAAITRMVEDFWRSFLPIASTDQQTAALIVERFGNQVDDMAALMSPEHAATFIDMVEQERARLFDEYSANPARLKARLGVPDLTGAGPMIRQRQSNRMGLGELAVRTTVRATVWQGVASIFRALR